MASSEHGCVQDGKDLHRQVWYFTCSFSVCRFRPVLLQDYFGTILRYYFVAGAEIVPYLKRAFVAETKHLLEYEFYWSLELSLLPYVEMYRSSTYFFCAPKLTIWTVLVGSWWPGGLGSYRLPRRRYDPNKHTLPNYRPWVMSPMYDLVRFYCRAICNARHHQSKNVPIRNMRESDLLEVIFIN